MRYWYLSRRFSILLISCWIASPAALEGQSEARFSTRPGPIQDSVAIIMNNTVVVRGGSVALQIDPMVFSIATVAPGALFQTTVPNAAKFTFLQPLDAAFNLVPGGVLFGWINGTVQDEVINPGEHELLVLQLNPNMPGGVIQKNCAAIDFLVEGLRSGTNVSLQKNAVTSDGSQTFLAEIIDGAICICSIDLDITTAALPNATEDAAYNFTLLAGGGTPPLTWSLSGPQMLPPGMNLSPAGVLSGTPPAVPTSTGVYPITVQVCDSCPRGIFCVTKLLTLTVNAKPPAVPPPAGGGGGGGGGGGCSAIPPQGSGGGFDGFGALLPYLIVTLWMLYQSRRRQRGLPAES